MVYDSLLWGETTQNNGLAGVNGKGPPPIQYTGDTNILRKGVGMPIIVGLGGTSVTKPTGCAIVGNRSYGVNKFCGPATLDFGIANGGFLADIAVPFQEGESLTAQLSNTNTNEASIVQADCAYGTAHKRADCVWDAMAAAGGGELWSVPTSITAAAAVTPAYIQALDASTTDTSDLWLDTNARYHILGYVSCVGVASNAATISFSGLGGEWAGYMPGIPASGIKATFDTNGLSLCYEPIPFVGDAVPGVWSNALANTALLGGIILARH